MFDAFFFFSNVFFVTYSNELNVICKTLKKKKKNKVRKYVDVVVVIIIIIIMWVF